MTEFKIAEYDAVAEKISKLKEVADFIPDASSKDGYDKSKRISLDVGKVKTSLEKVRKEKKAYFLSGGKEVDVQAKAIGEQLDAIQKPHQDAYKLVDTVKKEREAERKAALEQRVAYIRELPDNLAYSSSDEIEMALTDLNHEECLDYYEFTEQALKARNASRTALATLLHRRKKEENDARELAKLREEAAQREVAEKEAKVKAEQDQRVKDAEEAVKAKAQEELRVRERELKYEAERVEKERREQAEKAEQDRIEGERREEESRKAVARAQEAAKQAVIDAEKAAAQKTLDDAQKAKQEELKRERNKAHAKKINNQAVTCLVKIEGVSKELAIDIVRAVAKKQIDNIFIQY